MTKRMLIDATHAEETRVVVLDGSRLEDFDVETAAKKQLKGNIYLAKVVRVEPSLQAAFVEYGGGRHGFLAFGEIHPDYYQIPVADRQRLLELQEAEARAEEEAEDAAAAADEAAERAAGRPAEAVAEVAGSDAAEPEPPAEDDPPLAAAPEEQPDLPGAIEAAAPIGVHSQPAIPEPGAEPQDPEPGDSVGGALTAPIAEAAEPAAAEMAPMGVNDEAAIPGHPEVEHMLAEPVDPPYGEQAEIAAAIGPVAAADAPDAAAEPDEAGPHRTQAAAMAQDVILGDKDVGLQDGGLDGLGADLALEAAEPAMSDAEFAQPEPEPAGERDEDRRDDEHREDEPREDEPRESRAPARFMRSYKIQEVIRRRQILLVQVVKEERGSKGAALTTYISLAGRFSVLMPNSPRGGGISRKITSTADRRRLKEVTSELQIPRGMGLIVRTAGANRPKAEIKRDCEYLLELWDSIRETTMKSIAPALIHEEANLIKRAIRDNYSRDVDEVLVDGEAGWRAARDFMRMLMPAHARKVALWNDPQPLFAKYQVEAQLDAMLTPVVQLKSGGYLVINQTEALVAIDVNSGRSTRERGIEETALKTNLEAADEVARQLRLRDLAGLIVIDFIDMESRRNNAAVEKRMKDALKDDRARIQLGAISSFGLMEMSRQRLRPSLAETSFTPCPHCGGTGHVRSTETSALAVLRAIEEEGAKRRAAEITVHVAGAIALYVLNHKRVRLAEIEARYGMTVTFAADETLLPPQTRIERLRAQIPGELPEPLPPIPIRAQPIDAEDDLAVEEADEADDDEDGADEAPAAAGAPAAAPSAGPLAEGETRKRRRRRRGGRREDGAPEAGREAGREQVRTATVAAPEIDPATADQPDLPLPPAEPVAEPFAPAGGLSAAAAEEARGRRRGRRGGRRRRRDEPGGEASLLADGGDEGAMDDAPASFDAPPRPQYTPQYTGPTPADPFGGGVFDIYDVMEQAEARAAASPPPPVQAPAPPPVAASATVPAPSSEAVTADAVPPAPAAVEAAAADPVVAEVLAADVVVSETGATETVATETVATETGATDPGVAVEQTVPLAHAANETLPDRQPDATPEPVAAAPVAEQPPADSRPEPVVGPISAPVIIGASDYAVAEKKRGWWRR